MSRRELDFWPSWRVNHKVQLPSGGRHITMCCYVAAPTKEEAARHAQHELDLEVIEVVRA